MLTSIGGYACGVLRTSDARCSDHHNHHNYIDDLDYYMDIDNKYHYNDEDLDNLKHIVVHKYYFEYKHDNNNIHEHHNLKLYYYDKHNES
mmetsp:Transcript_29086/g.76812  ORF Transcript_29086/g.76812 Transcript_29086/m.76812 type:complete len:90 (-) Transcript_29086:769-1038(-)